MGFQADSDFNYLRQRDSFVSGVREPFQQQPTAESEPARNGDPVSISGCNSKSNYGPVSFRAVC
jgi:hypothetical protein